MTIPLYIFSQDQTKFGPNPTFKSTSSSLPSQSTITSNSNTNTNNNTTNCMCFDARTPSFDTVIYGQGGGVRGFLPAASYDFSREGVVTNSCTGKPIPPHDLFARTNGPIFGVTMGSCVPRASQSHILDFNSGLFNALPSTNSRKCFL